MCGDETVEAYLRVGRTMVLQAVLFACWEPGLMLRLSKAMMEFAFLKILFICLLQERLLLMVTPRYFESDFVANFWPWMK